MFNNIFKNTVLKASVSTKKWFKASLIRAIKTMAQSALGIIGTSVVLSDVNINLVIGAVVVSGITSLLTSITGIPEVESEE